MRVSPQTRLEKETLIGRDELAARLARSLDDVVAGAKRAVVLLGAPGIGKTALLRSAFRDAGSRDFLAALVRVPAAAGLPPRFPLGEVLNGLIETCVERRIIPPDRLRRVADTLTGATTIDEYAVALPQIADALEDLGRLGPLGIFVDDYDWAPSEGTGPLLAALRIAETPVYFVATARLRGFGDDPPSALPEPTADLWVEHVEVPGLSPTAVAALACDVLGGEALPSLADLLYARTLGNPLFIAEALQEWREKETLTKTGGFWGLADQSAALETRSLREMIAGRLSRLDEDSLSVARSLAIVGREALFDELAGLVETSRERLVEILAGLSGDGLVVCDSDPFPRYRLAHPLYESTLLSQMGGTRRAALHGRFSSVLLQRGTRGSAAELAHHAVRALEQPADLSSIVAAAAAEAESAGSYEEAATWYGHLAELADDPRALVAALAGRASAAIRTDPELSIQLFSYALELEDDDTRRARLLFGRARAHRVGGAIEETLADLEGALTLSDETDRFEIRHAIGASYGMRGQIDQAEVCFRALAEENIGTPNHAKAVGHLSMCAITRGDLSEGARLAETALADCTDDAYAKYLRTNLAWLHLLLGRWPEAEALIERAISEAVAGGDIYGECALVATAGRLAGWRGDLASAFDKASRAQRLAKRLGNPADTICATDVLALALSENNMATEAAALLPDVLQLDGPGVEPREFSYSYVVLGEACLRAGDFAGARAAVARGRIHLQNAAYWRGAIERIEAQLDLACGDALGAAGKVGPWIDQPMPIVYEQGRLLEVAADALTSIGDKTGGLSAADEALRIFTRLGAERPAERVATWIRAHTARRAGRPRSNLPGHLTEREVEILQLVVLGRSNREIALDLTISLGTAKKHVENVMAKAGASRRTELVPFAISLGVLTTEALVAGPDARRRLSGTSREE